MMVDALRDRGGAWTAVSDGLLSVILEHARRSCPYWKRHAPTGTSFEHIPPLTKTILRERWADLQARGVSDEQRFEGATSGSSGEPLRYANDRTAVAAHLASYDALRTIAGIPLDVPTVFISTAPPGSQVLPPGWIEWSIQGLTPAGVPHLVESWSSVGRYFVQGHSSVLEWIALHMQAQGVEFEHPPLAAVASRDMMSTRGRATIAEVFGCPVHSWYGNRETCAMLAFALEDGAAYAFNPLLSHVEVVDDDGRPVAPGETGRLIVTDLHNRVCPMIRYDTQDLAVATTERRGAWPTIAGLQGRSGEFLRLPGGRAVNPTGLGTTLFGMPYDFSDLVTLWRLQTARDALELRVVWRRPPSADDHARLEAAVRSITGPETRVTVLGVDALETLPSGKRWLIRPLPDEV